MPRCKLLLLVMVFFPFVGAAQVYQCPATPEVRIVSSVSTDVDIICQTALKTFSFLDRFHLWSQQPLTVNMVNEPIKTKLASIYGGYNPYRDEILLMHYAAIRALPEAFSIFSENFDTADYAGIIAHELTHAVVQHLLHIDPSRLAHEYVVAQEYLAYATQLAVMPEERRRSVISALNISPWQFGDVISANYMALAPHKFAVKSYLHLTSMEDPHPFISALLKTHGVEMYVP